MINHYIVADEYDWTGPYKNRTAANKVCKQWRLEGRNAEVLRRVPKALAARPRAITPTFYERTAAQVFNHGQPITAPDWDVPQHNEQPRLPEPQGRWAGWIQREPTLTPTEKESECVSLALSASELWMEHRGWSS